MHISDIDRMMQMAKAKAEFRRTSPVGYLLLSILAGAYLGLGICLIFSVGAPFAADGSAAVKLIMGVSFGIALTLVIFAGSELFTGNNMVCMIGGLSRSLSWLEVGQVFLWSLCGNLLGSLGVAWLIAQSGVLANAPQADLLMKVAATKMSLPAWELFVRGILCNWLVCLAVWMAARTKDDTAKILLIFWCLFAFVGSGFEHSIANQSVLGMALFLPHGAEISWTGFLWNQCFVVFGNMVGGAVLVGGAYWVIGASHAKRQAARASTISAMPALVAKAEQEIRHA
ncbi:MAG: formate/nitrite transporter family protein [Nitrospirae bacterium]|nr:MAG: formate/nitrite transporter family protein [Nitrospirota bacterium]